jgi:hypothetical protein
MDTTSRYEVAGGTVAGRSHAALGRANQDAYAWAGRGDVLAAVVCDGCGSGAHSEVGARIGACLLAERLSARLGEGAPPDDPALLRAIGGDLLAALDALAGAMGGSRAQAVADCFLFTVVGLALSGERGCVFAAGDGIVAVDGDVTRIGPFPGNEPPYLGYGLIHEGAPGLTLVRAFSGARCVLVGTDGAADLADLACRALPDGGVVGPLRQFWEDDRYFANRDAVRRRLAIVNREVTRPLWDERRIERTPGLLDDDTTLVVARRRHRD